MTVIDILIMVYLTILAFLGYIKGFFDEVFGIVGVLGGIIFSVIAGKSIGAMIATFIPGDNLPFFLGYILAFVIVFVISWFTAKALKKVLTVFKLENIDKLMGAFLGFLKGAAIIGLVLAALTWYPVKHISQMVARSKICQFVLTQENLDHLKNTAPMVKEFIEEKKNIIENISGSKDSDPQENKPENNNPPK